jgi:hypothetical protein
VRLSERVPDGVAILPTGLRWTVPIYLGWARHRAKEEILWGRSCDAAPERGPETEVASATKASGRGARDGHSGIRQPDSRFANGGLRRVARSLVERKNPLVSFIAPLMQMSWQSPQKQHLPRSICG